MESLEEIVRILSPLFFISSFILLQVINFWYFESSKSVEGNCESNVENIKAEQIVDETIEINNYNTERERSNSTGYVYEEFSRFMDSKVRLNNHISLLLLLVIMSKF